MLPYVMPATLVGNFSEQKSMINSDATNSFGENTEQLFQLPPLTKRFRPEADASSAASPSASKSFPNYEKHVELLKLRTENAKLQSKLNALNIELTECKIQLTNDRENNSRNKLEMESRTRTIDRLVADTNDKGKEWKNSISNMKRISENEKLRLREDNSNLLTKIETLEKQLLEATLQNQTTLQSMQDELSAERKRAMENSLQAERLNKELTLCQSKYLDLERIQKTTKNQLSLMNRKCEEQSIAMRQWREENQLATALRHDLQDLKALRKDNSSLKEQLQRYKNVSDNVILIKQEKAFLDEELKRINALLQKYVNENSELKMMLSRQSHTDNGSQITPRRSLSEIDSLSARCVQLKDELQEKSTLIERLIADVAEKETKIEQLTRSSNAQSCKIEKLDSAVQISMVSQSEEKVLENLKTQLKAKEDQIVFLLKKQGLELDYNPETTCVVHMVQNPLDVAHREHLEQISRMTEENKIMSLRIEELEKLRKSVVQKTEPTSEAIAGTSTNDVTVNVQMRLEDIDKDSEISRLNATISKLREQRDRVAKTYKQMGTRYRDACTFLTGYDIKVNEGQVIRIQSIYEKSSLEQPCFLIKKSAADEYQLMANDYVEKWRDLVEEYLNVGNSFPAFFAAITLNLQKEETDLNTSSATIDAF